jgi:hypothetical protein
VQPHAIDFKQAVLGLPSEKLTFISKMAHSVKLHVQINAINTYTFIWLNAQKAVMFLAYPPQSKNLSLP